MPAGPWKKSRFDVLLDLVKIFTVYGLLVLGKKNKNYRFVIGHWEKVIKNPNFVVCLSFKKFFTKLIFCGLIVIGKNPLYIYSLWSNGLWKNP